jgi:hypothetical protein
MTTQLAKPIKQQIVNVLQALVDAGTLSSFFAIDLNPNPLTMPATTGYATNTSSSVMFKLLERSRPMVTAVRPARVG